MLTVHRQQHKNAQQQSDRKGRKTEQGFILEGTAPNELTDRRLITFAYWTQNILGKEQLLNGQDGSLMSVAISSLASAKENSEQRYRLQAKAIDLTLTYSDEGLWQGLESALPAGRTLNYRLERYRNQPSKRSGEAIRLVQSDVNLC